MAGKFLIILVLLISLLPTGCQNKRELNDLGIVLGVGLDRGEGDNIRLTVQVSKPAEMKTSGEGGGKSPVAILTIEGKTVFEAARNMTLISSKKLFHSHNQAIIIGEALAKEDIERVTDFLERDHEVRAEVPLLISKGEARKILEIPGLQEKISAVEINDSLDAAEFSGKAQKVEFYQFLKNHVKEGFAPAVPYIEPVRINEKEARIISGMAVINKGKMTGILSPQETRGLLWVSGKLKSGIVVVKSPDMPDTDISLEVKQTKAKIRTTLKKGKPEFEVIIKTTSNIGEISGMEKITPDILKLLEQEQNTQIKKAIEAALTKSQKKLKADIFGFGEELHRSRPELWMKLKSRWNQFYPDIKVTITTDSTIEGAGDKTNPAIPGEARN